MSGNPDWPLRWELLQDLHQIHGGGLRGAAVLLGRALQALAGRGPYPRPPRPIRPEGYALWRKRNELGPAAGGAPGLHVVVALENGAWPYARRLMRSLWTLRKQIRALTLVPCPGDRGGEETCLDLLAEGKDWLAERPARVGWPRPGEDRVLVITRAGVLWPAQVATMHAALSADPQRRVVYADEDRIGDELRVDPWFKQAWDPDLAIQGGLLGSLIMLEPGIIPGEEIPRPLELDLLYRLREFEEAQIVHVPCVAFSGTAPFVTAAPLSEAHARIAGFLGSRTKALPGEGLKLVSQGGHLTVEAPEAAMAPEFSLVVTAGAEEEQVSALVQELEDAGLRARTQLLLVDPDAASPPAERQALAARHGAVRVPLGQARGLGARANLGAEVAQGETLVFLDLVGWEGFRDPEALDRLVAHASRTGVGLVAPVLWRAGSQELVHGGLVLGVEGLVGPAFPGLQMPARRRLVDLVRGVSAVSGSCLAIRRDRFEACGGFDTAAFPGAYAEVDLGLRLRRAGLRNLVIPDAAAEVSGVRSLGFDVEGARALRARWGGVLPVDPGYNPNLALDWGDGSLAWRARSRRPRGGGLPESGAGW